MYYHVCPHCGAALDPGEHCDCEQTKENAALVLVAPGRLVDNSLHGGFPLPS